MQQPYQQILIIFFKQLGNQNTELTIFWQAKNRRSDKLVAGEINAPAPLR
jgi:hypothetical protein